MVSAINPLLPEDGVPAVKADLRANLLAAKSEIEALQAGGATGYMLNLAGAVTRTLGQLAIDQGLNVKEFGALGDGSGTTIQQWLSRGTTTAAMPASRPSRQGRLPARRGADRHDQLGSAPEVL